MPGLRPITCVLLFLLAVLSRLGHWLDTCFKGLGTATCIWEKIPVHAEVLRLDQGLFQHNCNVSGTQLYSFRASSAIFGLRLIGFLNKRVLAGVRERQSSCQLPRKEGRKEGRITSCHRNISDALGMILVSRITKTVEPEKIQRRVQNTS